MGKKSWETSITLSSENSKKAATYIVARERGKSKQREKQQTEANVEQRVGMGKKFYVERERFDCCETKPRVRVRSQSEEMTSCDVSHLRLVSVLVGVPINCRQLMHKVHPDLFATPRSMQGQGRDLRVSVIRLVICVMQVL